MVLPLNCQPYPECTPCAWLAFHFNGSLYTLIIPVLSSFFTSMRAAIEAIIIHKTLFASLNASTAIGRWNMFSLRSMQALPCEQRHEFHDCVRCMYTGRGPVLSLINGKGQCLH